MNMNSRRSFRRNQSGVMLLEALIGILIFSLGILAMVGLQTMSFRMATDSRDRAEAANLASQLIGDMWVNRTTLANYNYAGSGTAPAALTQWVTQVNASLPNAAANPPIVTTGVSPLGALAGSQTTVTLRWVTTTDPTVHQYVITAYIN
jgi:type IV pilus assembly protein PilV